MKRLVALGTVLTFVSVCHTSAAKVGTVVVDDGRVGIGLITGGNFGPGSFSIGAPGKGGSAQMPVHSNEDGGDGEHITLQRPIHNRGQQGNTRPPQRDSAGEPNKSGGDNRGNAPQSPAKPLSTRISGQGGTGGQILIGTVVLPNNNTNKGNKRKNGNKQPFSTDASALEAIFASNGANNGFPSAEHGSIQIDSITGGNFGPGAMSLNNNQRPVANVPNKGSAVNNGNNGYPYTGNEALYTIGHGTNGGGITGDGYNYGQMNSGYNSGSSEEPWIWS